MKGFLHEVRSCYRKIGIAAKAIADGLEQVYNLGKKAVEGILDAIGFAANAIRNALCFVFGC